MTQMTTALTSLLPAAGAVALAVQGIRRMTKASASTPRAAPPQPKELPAAVPAARRSSAPDGICAGCGTDIPARMTYCAICERAGADKTGMLWTTALHWLVLMAMIAAFIGIGLLISP
jgi:hypothetical protein